ncbi:bile acid:sodium symporter family protein [Nocardioides campestrisoli]|uniref:bile acid:sodium symporter family protein n=1 Tax=Nocardioides campestrisoli TaxID=2736757 RepID=UPI0015E6E85C|nr:bile acid:sodium symporter family protein [Nocardioides campestrisoli]
MIPDLLPLAADVDSISIAFEEGSLTTLKIVIGAILFGIALDTRLEDFALAARRPGTIAIGVVAQFLLLPALTFGLTLLLDVRSSVALGMILVACCPPGNVSNILTHRARGDVALSVSMTAVGNVLAIFAMPLNVAFWGALHPTGKAVLEDIELSAWDMLSEIALVIGLPFVAGITIARLWPVVAARAGKVVGPVAFLGLGAVIVVGVANNWSIFLDYIGVVVIAVFLHDALALLLGYGIAKATRLPDSSTRAMTFEVGIRNAGLGLLLVFTYFDGLGGMALVAAWWGIWDIIAGLAVAQWWRSRTTTRRSQEAAA